MIKLHDLQGMIYNKILIRIPTAVGSYRNIPLDAPDDIDNHIRIYGHRKVTQIAVFHDRLVIYLECNDLWRMEK